MSYYLFRCTKMHRYITLLQERHATVLGIVYAPPIVLADLMAAIPDVDKDIVQFQLENTESFNSTEIKNTLLGAKTKCQNQRKH